MIPPPPLRRITPLQTPHLPTNTTNLPLAFHIPKIKPPDRQNGKDSTESKTCCDVVTHHDVWLFISREGEDWDPGCEDVCESVHLIDIRWADSRVKDKE
jgi:hypothetical protein